MSLLRTAAIRATRVPQLARAASTTAPHVVSSRSNQDGALLSNIEAHWSKLPAAEQYEVFQALEEAQKKDWKQLTTDEKKAAYFIAFGPHGPRAPILPEGGKMKVFAGVLACVAAAVSVFAFVRSQAPPPPKTWNREYQEMSNEYLKSQNSNPISGISSEGYKGKGMVMCD
ncbi:cytochrome c oxidase subunit V [Trichosporon asahii var. asahii CBS 8904]|uniref:Cytochrome c oxidase subunit V n=1 Tax=Trichosporon asahii var. asahii (strain CBS 8904) TaxID=1220162 RepID=K1WJ14_TRIAC|nr:cytochrome c oxidase subunit V [Trichosporon asahii var. asahii CBS 8904]